MCESELVRASYSLDSCAARKGEKKTAALKRIVSFVDV